LIIDKSHGHADGTGWFLQGTPGGRIVNGRASVAGEVAFGFGRGGGPGDFIFVGTKVRVLDNQFHHVTGVFTGSELQIYLDGVLTETTPFSGLPVNNSRDVILGRSWGGGTPTRYFHGLIDEAHYYNRALDPSEILDIISAESPEAPSLVHLSPADGSSVGQGFRTVTIQFSEPMSLATVTAANLQLFNAGGVLVAPRSLQLVGGDRQVELTYAPLPM
jgi:hypothetical protein